MAMPRSVFVLVFCAVLEIAQGRATNACNNLGIIGGHKIPIKAAPYMAGLFDNGQLVCGASIIHEQFVLTTAACFKDYQINQVHIGSRHVELEGTYIDVAKGICHDDYNAVKLYNNICVLKLSEPVKFSRKVAKVQLADETFVTEEGALVNITGWGSKKGAGGAKYPIFLRQTTVPVLSEKCCHEIDPGMPDTQFCALSPGHDFCQKDEGGPVTFNNVQIGIMSNGVAKACGKEPGFSTKVSKFYNWIQTTINSNL